MAKDLNGAVITQYNQHTISPDTVILGLMIAHEVLWGLSVNVPGIPF
jgi:hypothetical protein